MALVKLFLNQDPHKEPFGNVVLNGPINLNVPS